MLPLQREKHRCSKIQTGRKGRDGRIWGEGGAQGREGYADGAKGRGVVEGGTGFSYHYSVIMKKPPGQVGGGIVEGDLLT